MKVLLDENLPHRLRSAIAGHDVSTVAYLGWAGVKNGELLTLAENSAFDVFLTADSNLIYQQNLSTRRIAIVLLTALRWSLLQRHLPATTRAIDEAGAGGFVTVHCDGD